MFSALWLLQVAKDAIRISHDFLIGSEQAMICINHGCLFIQIAGAYTPVISIAIIDSLLNNTEFGVYLQVWKPCQYFRPFLFKAVLPFKICFFIESRS